MRGLLIACILLLGGCARLPDTCTTVLPRAAYCIQGVEGNDAFSVLQQVEFQGDGASGRFLVRLEVDKTAFRMALLTMLGQSLGSVRYGGSGDILIVVPGGEQQFDMLMPAAYVQWALWPKEQVAKGFPDRSLEVREESGRRVFLDRKGRTVMTIDYEGAAPAYNRLVVSSPEGRQAIITTLEKD